MSAPTRSRRYRINSRAIVRHGDNLSVPDMTYQRRMQRGTDIVMSDKHVIFMRINNMCVTEKAMGTYRHHIRRAAVLAAAALILSCCGRHEDTPDSGFAEYIEAYTGGIVTSDDCIAIELASPAEGLQGSETELEEAAAKLFKFSPALEGTARWANPQRLEFTPAPGALKSGKRYSCTFRLGNIAETDRNHKEFTFSFMTARKEAALELTSMVIGRDDPDKAYVSGTLTFSKSVDATRPEDLLDFRWSGKGGSIEVHEISGSKYGFSVSGLERDGQARALTVKFKPGRTGFPECRPLNAYIPARGQFFVTDARMSSGDDRYVDVTFSEPLDGSQRLDGLFSLATSDGKGTSVSTKVSDNNLRIYYETSGDGPLTVKIDGAVKDAAGNALGECWTKTFSSGSPAPQVKFPFPRKGSIIPHTDKITVPFNAVNLNAVDISVIKIFPSNILMYLQENDLQGDSELRRAGKLIYRNCLRLDSDPSEDLTKMQTFTVGLDNLFKKEPGAIYRLKITFRPEYYIYYKGIRGGNGGMVSTSAGTLTEEEKAKWDEPKPYFYDGGDYDWSKYRWQDRKNPLTPSYYMDYDYPSRNIMVSEIGAIAKYGDKGQLWIAASDITTAEPVSGAEVKIYSYQLQTIGKGKTGSDGLSMIKLDGKPFIATVKKGSSTTYLKITDGKEKSLSRFDTGGETLQKGLKGFVYGERGVWRPGDTLHLTMILHSEDGIPDTHPASMDIYTPTGQFFARKVCSKSEHGFYRFDVPVGHDCPTGLWNAYVKVGGATFHKPVRIEAIKPNRLKVNSSLGSGMLRGGEKVNAGISATWLTGPAASGLRAQISMTLKPGSRSFKGYGGYTFSDPASRFEDFTTELVDTRLNADGKASAAVTLPKAAQAPGMLSASVVCSVEEDGGDESYSTMTMPFSPFSSYVGIKLPEGDSYLETGKSYSIPVANVDMNGRKVSGHRLEWRIFKLKWSWWWESRQEPLDSYVNASAASAASSGIITSGTGDMSIPFNVDDSAWGRYLIYIKDLDSGHAAGGTVYADRPAYRGRSDRNNPDAPAMLSFSTDKKKYSAGETATVFIPAAKKGRALVSIEKGGKVLSGEWVKTSAGTDTPYKIKVTGDMAPNFYVHITLVQPYRNSSYDLPLRMYGVIPVMVENAASHLEPVISMPDRLHPEEPFTIKVSEKHGKPMTYTLAVVDEGLLDLTAFRTPDPWNFMYRREALGVRTWDMYDDVFGSGGGALSAMFSIGGDEGLTKGVRKENRFNPVVKVLGPFTLKSGSRSHKITLPMYVGSVRTMVVAGYDGAYGNAEKTVPVTSPVMILPTLPRIAGCSEHITLPVNVFVMEDGIDKVNVSVKTEGPLSVDGKAVSSVAFSGKGDKMIRFSLSSAPSVAEGGETARVTVTAEGNGHKMTETVSIEVRNPSPLVTSTSSALLGKGESMTFRYTPFKAGSGNSAWLEASGCPAPGWDALFCQMRNYPHSCSEQISAKGISMLNSMPMLSEENAEKASKMIPELLSELYSRQLPDGGFAYWPGETYADEWVSSMAGEFMTGAAAAGYTVNSGVLGAWQKFQKRCTQNYRTAKTYRLSDLTQAYRLYAAALSGNADEPAMNRMKEGGNLSWQASSMLACAYSLCGKKNVAKEILESAQEQSDDYGFNVHTFGTPLRDKAIALEALIRTGDIKGAVTYAGDISRSGSGIRPWSMSTQESAFLARAMGLLAKEVSAEISVNVNEKGSRARTLMSGNGTVRTARTDLTPENGEVTVQNTSAGAAYIRLTTVSQAAPGEAMPAASSALSMKVSYIAPDGEAISPSSIRQGTEFTAVIKVSNPNRSEDLWDMALTEIIPSGWEIINDRMRGQDTPSSGKYDYLDIRDDRNTFYFSLPAGESREFRVRLRAAYEGKFFIPPVTCGAMYDPNVYARTASGSAEVTR